MTSDDGIHSQISQLVAREKELRQQLQDGEISPDDENAELHTLEVQLDQCWDLLRQRRAKRQYGEDPDDAEPRPEPQVESYLQ